MRVTISISDSANNTNDSEMEVTVSTIGAPTVTLTMEKPGRIVRINLVELRRALAALEA